MTDDKRVSVLVDALRRICDLCECRDDAAGFPIPKKHFEKVRDWAQISAVASRALRDVEE